jgi:hypothetical protein
MAKVKTVNPELLIEEEEDGSITVEGWADDIEKHKEQIKALVRIKAGNPGFSCKECGKWFQPQPRQLIFYMLCDECFIVYTR